jgi:hypothetical protein
MCHELVRVYDASLCHWVYDICVPSLGRVLNAACIKAITTAPRPEVFKWKEHRTKLLAQFRNTAEQDGILTFFLNVREEGLSAILWISERRSQREPPLNRTAYRFPNDPGCGSPSAS